MKGRNKEKVHSKETMVGRRKFIPRLEKRFTSVK